MVVINKDKNDSYKVCLEEGTNKNPVVTLKNVVVYRLYENENQNGTRSLSLEVFLDDGHLDQLKKLENDIKKEFAGKKVPGWNKEMDIWVKSTDRLRVSIGQYSTMKVFSMEDTEEPPTVCSAYLELLQPHASILSLTLSITGIIKNNRQEGQWNVMKWVKNINVPCKYKKDSVLYPHLSKKYYKVMTEEAEDLELLKQMKLEDEEEATA